MRKNENGEIKSKKTDYDFSLVSGQLYPGETGSGKIVTEIKKQADQFESDLQILDTPPGTGCPVIAALQDCDFAVVVSEPTPAGFADIKKTLKVLKHFQIPWGLVVNKYDINQKQTKSMESWAERLKAPILGRISFDKEIFIAISQLTPIMETDLAAKKEIEAVFNNLKSINL